jgi:predicted ATPase
MLAVADEMARLAQEEGEATSSLIAGRALANTWFFLGDLDAARRHAEAVIAAYDPIEHAGLGRLYSADPYVMCAFFLAHSLLRLGYPEQARPWSEAGLARAREVADVVTLAHALHHTCLFEHRGRQPLAVRAAAEELIACATEHGLPFWLALGRLFDGAARADLGQTAEGMAELRAGIRAYRATEGRLYLPFALALRADLCRLAGDVDDGLHAITEAKELVAKTGVRGFEAYLHRLEGTLLLARHPPDPQMAEACLRRAIEVADQQGARLAQLRAGVAMAGLWQAQGKRAEAHDLLAPIYGWFTEGFDTADLKDARVLLDELS